MLSFSHCISSHVGRQVISLLKIGAFFLIIVQNSILFDALLTFLTPYPRYSGTTIGTKQFFLLFDFSF